jgi:phosphohistidine phosphatase SixA
MIFKKRICLGLMLALSVLAWPAVDSSADQSGGGGEPKAIYIIRHGEKPDSSDDPDLAPKGYDRANALARVFPSRFCVPDFIWATAPSKHSRRPLETVAPLAKALHLTVLDEYADADFAKLAHDLLTQPQYSGKSVLICWHHGTIADLANALGANDAPEKWKPEVFDRVWVIKFVAGRANFQDLPEKALAGDSEN